MTTCKDKCWCRNLPFKPSDPDLPPLMYNLRPIEDKIQHLYDGVENCFEAIEKSKTFLRQGWKAEMLAALHPLLERIENLEGYIEMEDRITASDILFRLSQLETNVYFEKAKELIYAGAQMHASMKK